MLETIKKVPMELNPGGYDPTFSSLISYQFTPHPYPLSRLQNCEIFADTIDGKGIYLLDGYFTSEEGEAMRRYTEKATFSRKSFGSEEAIARGEMPAKTMNNQERWLFFSLPPTAITPLYKLFSGIGHALDATVSLVPWELSDGSGSSSPALLANHLTKATRESMELGIHKDSNPSQKVPYGIPKLYAEGEFFPAQFPNGARGNPLIVTAMVYVTAENYLPNYRMGTLFYDCSGEPVFCSGCENMRIVLFEGDIDHTIEESNIPEEIDTWRVSYVYKLFINPHKPGQDLRKEISKVMGGVYAR